MLKNLEKLFEKILDSFLKEYNIINESQYGFQSGRSTTMAITDLVESITDAEHQKVNYMCIY